MKIETKVTPINNYKFDIAINLSARELVALITVFNQVGGALDGPRSVISNMLPALRAIVPESVKDSLELDRILSCQSMLKDTVEHDITLSDKWPDTCN